MDIETHNRITAQHIEYRHKHHVASLMINNAKSATSPRGSPVAYGLHDHQDRRNDIASTSPTDELGNSENSSDNKKNGEGSGAARIMNSGRWSSEEHKRFLAGLDQFGTGNWKKITDMVGTRSCTQIRTHAQKYFIALQKPHNDDNSGYARKKSKMLVGAEHHLNTNIKTGSSAIITGYGGGGTPIHPNKNHGSPANGPGHLKQFWGPEGLRDNNSGLTGMEVLAQAAITGEKNRASGTSSSSSSCDDRPSLGGTYGHFNHYESSLDKAVAELRKKIASEAEGAVGNKNTPKTRMKPTMPSQDLSKGIAESAAAKRKLEDARASAVVSSYQEHTKKLKVSDYAAAVQDTIDRKDVLEKLQAVAERQEFLRLRQEVKTLNQTIIQLQQQSIESDNRVMEAITDRRVTLNECKNLREINAQLKSELRRMVLLFEHSGGSNHNANSNSIIAAATQGANVELMQARLTESELRYHTVTESLSRQTGVLTDQHRAILELNNQLEKERIKRHSLEIQLKEVNEARAAEK